MANRDVRLVSFFTEEKKVKRSGKKNCQQDNGQSLDTEVMSTKTKSLGDEIDGP